MAEKKWDKSDNYVLNFHEGREDAYYLAQIIYNDNKQDFEIESDIKGYFLVICNIEYNPDTNEIGGADPFYSDLRLLIQCNKRSEKNYNLALEKMEEEARLGIEIMESDKKFLESLAKENDIDVDEMRKKIKKIQEDVNCGDDFGMKFGLEKKEEVKKERKPKKKVTFDDVAGMQEVKDVFLDVIDQLKNPEKYEYFDIEPIKSVLMHGKPGVGKTYIANAFANMIDANFVKVNMGDIASKYQGQTGNNIKRIFDEARKSNKFTVLFADEIDSLANRRTSDENSKEKNSTLNVLLNEMSSDENDNIFLIFATNFVELLDPAFLRSKRCDIKIEIPLPDFETRLQVLELNTKRKPLGSDVDLEEISEMMEGSNCADVSLLCSQGARIALKKDKMEINQEDFIEALEKLNMKKKEEEKKKQIGFSLNK